MINYLKGEVKIITVDSVILEVNDIGYEILVNVQKYDLNEMYQIYIYEHIREKEYKLFGFQSIEMREIFLNLLKVRGVGCITAHNIVCLYTINEIYIALRSCNVDFFTKVPKVGKKVAYEIIESLNVKHYTQSEREFIRVCEVMGIPKLEVEEYIKLDGEFDINLFLKLRKKH